MSDGTPTHTIQTLPPVLGIIARVTSLETAIAFGEAYGGKKTYLPERVTRRSRLVAVVGYENARKIVAECGRPGGYHIDIPVFSACPHPTKRSRILAETGTTREIAGRVGCSERYVREVRNEGRRS